MRTEIITLDGHIIDSLTLSKVLDILVSTGVDYEIRRFEIGKTHDETSHAEILVRAPDEESLQRALHEVQQHGAVISQENAKLQPAPQDGVFPDGFYSTTNLETFVRIEDTWILVERIEMDCGIRVSRTDTGWRAECVPLHRARKGDLFVVGTAGVRVTPAPRREAESVFHFMGSEVSIEKPKARIVQAVARAIRDTKASGRKVLFVGGPAIVHTGAAPYLERIIRAGWIDVLFAGNALATHDIEYALYGTSLGVALDTGIAETHGHEHHLRAINTIRALGGIRQAMEKGVLKGGIMHACVVANVHVVLAGSIRDDGPLPDVITDVMQAQDAMREAIQGVGLALMVATTLHSIATGNLLPASVTTFCVDADADTVIKLTDRGSHQAFGIVTDCAFFLKELAEQLCGKE
ncbi:MAG: TIGR00300 family protein [Chthonomonadetes bacterium]|nr:TIGR00300 family protein [Chthonomonadetes bacterium]